MTDIQTLDINVDEIGVMENKLRSVDTNNEDFKNLKGSIQERGLINAISIRENPNVSEVTPQKYLLVDGGHRFAAVSELNSDGIGGFETIKASVLNIEGENEALLFQIEANTHRLATSKAEYAKALFRILVGSDITKSELARRLNVTPSWVTQMLSLVKLPEHIQTDIDSGEIKASSAVLLARLPADEWDEWAEKARNMSTTEFITSCNERLKEIKENKASGKGKDEYVPPVATVRSRGEIMAMYEAAATDDDCPYCEETLAYIVKMDQATLDQHKVEWEQKQRNRQLNKIKTKARKAAKTLSLEVDKDTSLEKMLSMIQEKDSIVGAAFTSEVAAIAS